MEGYATEEQQVEAFKKWWAKNGKSVIAAVIIGFGGFFGGRAWFDYKTRTTENASITYQNMHQAMQQQNIESAMNLGGELVGKYNDTPYAAMASMAMAKLVLAQGKHDAAAAHLKWAMEHSPQQGMQHLARIRLAEVLLDQGKADDALKTLEVKEQGGYISLYENAKGDSYRVKGDNAAARQAYAKALLAMPADSPLRPLVQMKLDDLGKLQDNEESKS